MVSTRYNYVIGDVQGCFAALKALLKTIKFDPEQDVIWFAGDLVARGEDSLGVLRFVKKLSERGAAHTVLGNHDLNLLACAREFKQLRKKDRTKPIIDAHELIEWLRHQPLCLFPNKDTLVTHAGIPHIWSAEQLAELSKEVEFYVGHEDLIQLDYFLKHMYGEEPSLWSNDLQGLDRLRCITNYITRMRLINEEGRLEFSFKDELNQPMPEGFKPWFEFDGLAEKTHEIIFGHWAALEGAQVKPNIQNVDGGCVWGNQLIAYRLEDKQAFAVNNPIDDSFL